MLRPFLTEGDSFGKTTWALPMLPWMVTFDSPERAAFFEPSSLRATLATSSSFVVALISRSHSTAKSTISLTFPVAITSLAVFSIVFSCRVATRSTFELGWPIGF